MTVIGLVEDDDVLSHRAQRLDVRGRIVDMDRRLHTVLETSEAQRHVGDVVVVEPLRRIGDDHAMLTGHKEPVSDDADIHMGGGERLWVFYTRTTRVFGERLNEALAGFERLPITIYTEIDPD